MTPQRFQNGGDPLGRALEQAKAQQRAQEQMQQVMLNALNAPHTLEVTQISLAVLAPGEPGQARVLMVATPDGKRRDIVLSPQALAAIAQAASEQAAVQAQEQTAAVDEAVAAAVPDESQADAGLAA
jgi:hypothetical protein